jgi:large subunit ribosomal protein L12
MESVYAALILHKAGKKITEDAVEKILKAAGVTPDKASLTKLISGLKGADINAILASAAAAPVMTASAAGVPAAQEAPKEAKKEEAEEEDEEPTGIGSLF